MSGNGSDPADKAVARQAFAVSAFAGLVLSAITVGFVWFHLETVRHDAKAQALLIAESQAALIQQQLSHSVSATYTLAAVVRRYGMKVEPEWFTALVEDLAPYFPEIDSFQYAPSGIVQHIVPLEGNLGAIGHDLLADHKRTAEARAAVKSGRLTLAGPFPLIQGGNGIVARLPVYRNAHTEQEFWGFASVLMRIDTLIDSWQIRNLEGLGYRWSLWREIDADESIQVFGGENLANNGAISVPISVPGGEWRLSLNPKAGWAASAKTILALELLFGMSVSIAGAFTLYNFVRAPIRLKREVDRRTEELRVASIAFEAQEGIMVTDADMRILRVNHSFTRLTGYEAGDVIGQTPWLLQSGKHDAAFYRELRKSLSKNGFWEGEIWNRKKSGELYVEWLTIAAVCNDHGTVTHYVGTFTDITERKNAERMINELAFFDPLTKIPNRRLFFDRLGQAIKDAKRSKELGAVLFIDLDGFKAINDRQGHHAGDAWLCEVASRLQSAVRSQDTVARLAGDEFVVMLQNLGKDPDQARKTAETIREKIDKKFKAGFIFGGQRCETSASTGIALIDPSLDLDADEILGRADREMYQRKQSRKPAPANDHHSSPVAKS